VIRISDLRELRELRRMTQERLAELLGTSQGTISKLERRRPPALRDLKHFVEAMGGELSLVARFPTQAVELVLGEDKPPSSR
jgi:transcriptional regulator with XRE-family HTH domain